MKKWKGLAAAAAVVVLSSFAVQLAGSLPAAAADSPISGIATTPSDKSQVKSRSLSCGPDQQVTGGGAAVYGDTSSIKITEMQPIDSHTYRARAAAPNYLDKAWSLQVWIICASGLQGWETKYGNSGTSGSVFKTTYTYPCSTGKYAISAGGYIYAAPDGLIGLSMIRPDGPLTIGRASARAVDGYQGSWSVSSVVICAYPMANRQYVDSLTNISNATASCPGSQVPFGLGGGGGLIDLGPTWLQEIAPTGDNAVRVRMTSLPNGGMVTQLTCGVFTPDPHPSPSF